MKSHFWLFTLAILATCAWPMLASAQGIPGAPPPNGYGYPPFTPPGAYPGAFRSPMMGADEMGGMGPGMMGQAPGRYAIPAAAYAPDMAVPGMVSPQGPPPGAMPMGPGPMGPIGPGGPIQMGSSVLSEPPPMGATYGGEYGDPNGGGYDWDGGYGCPGGDCGMVAGGKVWAEAELIWWNIQGRNVPALVTTSPNGTPQAQAGVLGEPDTTILYGDGRVGDSWRTGGRFSMGYWFGDKQEVALWVRGYSVGFEQQNFFAESTGDPIIARPFFNLELGVQDAVLVAFPGISEGNIAVRVSGDATGGDVLGRWALERGQGYRLDFLGGYQTANINDNLLITTNIVSTDPGGLLPVGTTLEGFDSFKANNKFNGGVVGLMSESQHGRFMFRFLGKVGLGNMRSQVTIDGQTVVTTPAPGPTVTVLDGNLLTQPSNIGTFSNDRFCVVPELNLTLTYQMTSYCDLMIGYSAIYYSSVATAGGSVDTNVNLSDPPSGPPGPLFAFDSKDLIMQGGNVGLLFHW